MVNRIRENEFTILGMKARNERDYETAMKYFKQAAEADDVFAIGYISDMYANGEGVPKSKIEAKKWNDKLLEVYKKRADAEDISSAYSIFRMYADGRMRQYEIDPTNHTNYSSEIFYWLKKMIDIDLTHIEDEEYSIELDEKLCTREEAMYEIAYIFHHGKSSWSDIFLIDKNINEAIKWYKRIIEDEHCNHFKTESMLALGVIYYKGNGIERDYSEARKWFEKAAESEYEASYALYEMYRDGVGVEKDLEESARWYDKAKSQYDKSRSWD